MKALFSLCFVGGLMLLASGCASSKLTLRLDIYGEDPSIAYLTSEELDGYERALKKAPEDIKEYAQDRQEFGARVYELYEAGFQLNLPPKPSTNELKSIQNRKVQWQKYTDELAGLREAAIQSAQQTAKKVHELRPAFEGPESRDKQREDLNWQFKQALDQVRLAINKLTGRMTNAFEHGLVGNFAYLKVAFAANAKEASVTNTAKWKGLIKKIDRLDVQIGYLAQKGSANMILLANALDAAAGESSQGADSRKSLRTAMEEQPDKTAIAIKDGLGAPEGTVSPTTNITSRLASLTPPSDHNNLDREQDPADPVWRILSDSRNDSKWHSAFATNYFYSEGNNSVVIVRDTPIHYRVHSADNNPTALIEGQLRISRALTDAAIQVAGTATGVKMPDLKPKPAQPDPNGGVPSAAGGAGGGTGAGGAGAGGAPAVGGVGADAGGASATDKPVKPEDGKTASLAAVEATIEAEIANRNATFKALSRSLIALRSDLDRPDLDDPTRTRLLGQLESVLKAYSAILQPDSSTSTE